jgi:hypothetical protein
LARVDLAHLLIFTRQYRYDRLPELMECLAEQPGEASFSERGWNIRECQLFCGWSAYLHDHGR